MSIASPNLRSSSTTAPRPSFSNWLTCIVVLPSTALTVTGMSYTASSSRTVRDPEPSAGSFSSASSMSSGTFSLLLEYDWCSQQADSPQRLGDLVPQRGGIAGGTAVAPHDALIARRHMLNRGDTCAAGQIRIQTLD